MISGNGELLYTWNAILHLHINESGKSEDEAKEDVIIKALELGDSRPFYDFVLQGYTPQRRVALYLAAMMAKTDSPGRVPTDLEADVPYGLKIVKAKGDRSNAEIVMRDYLIYRIIVPMIEIGKSKTEAASEAMKQLDRIGYKMELRTILNAYNKFASRNLENQVPLNKAAKSLKLT